MQGTHHDGATTATQYKFSGYFMTSAKTGEGIEEAMANAVEVVSIGKFSEMLKCEHAVV